MDVRDVLIRAAKTFVQAFLSTVTVTVAIGGDYAAVKAGAVAAGAAALAIIWNAALNWSSSE